MTAHTPGPWHWEIADGRDERLCNAHGITIVDGWDGAGTQTRLTGDASLIAAAPDMLAALKDLLNGYTSEKGRRAEAAIAKAEGTS